MRKLVQKFGTSGGVNNLPANIKLAESGELNDDTVKIITPEAGSFYLLASKEYNASSGAYRGHHLVVIAAPEAEVFGTVAAAHVNAAASTNSGVTVNYPNDSTVTIQRSSATYAVRFAVYRVF